MKYVYRLIVLLCTFIVVACDTAGNNNATLVVTSATDVNLGMYGDDITITYKISGDSEAIAKVDISASWLSIVEHSSSDNLILHVEDNTTGGTRMAAVTLSYGVSCSSVVVTQSASPLTPSIEIVSDSDITIERAGTMLEIAYTLENSNPQDLIYVKTDADWIYSIDTATDGIVRIGVATNLSDESRTTSFTIGYGSAEAEVALEQLGAGDFNFNAPILVGEYLGDSYTSGIGNYWFFLTDRGFTADGSSLPNTTYYRIDAYAPSYTDSTYMAPIPDGTYTFDAQNSYNEWTFTAEHSGFWVTDVNARRGDIAGIERGTLVVKDGVITLNVVINGQTHNVSYSGKIELENNPDEIIYYSTLRDDYKADLSDHELIYACYGDFYEYGYYNWMFKLQPKNGIGDCFQFDIITGYKDAESGFIGDYHSSDYLAQWSFIPGWTNQIEMLCSWYFTSDQSQLAPLRGGDMSVIDNGDGSVTVTIDVTDDRRNRITGSWTGVPQAEK